MQTRSTLFRIGTTLIMAWMILLGINSAEVRAEECPIKLPKQFKAVILTQTTMIGGPAQLPQQPDMNITVYVNDQDLRMESTMMSSLMLGKAEKCYMLNHDKKQYAETPFSKEAVDMLNGQFPAGLGWTKQGEEEINGKKCDQYSIQLPNMPVQMNTQIWVDPATKCPTQILLSASSPGGPTVNMRTSIAITEGPQKAEFFALPAGYQAVDMSSIMPGAPQTPQTPPATPE